MQTLTPDAALRKAVREDLTRWFAANRRALPWRRSRTPYRVFISELMLQQTRAEQAAPYFLRFMRRFPTVRALAGASRGEVLKLWEGLGYYARARNAQDAARHIVARLGGRFPRTMEGLLALPGVGRYTAAAVGSIAFGLDAAVLDGNVIRVLSRALAFGGDVSGGAAKKALQACADALLPKGRAGVFNEAMMELGAVCCTPRKPRCPVCPLRRACRALVERKPEAYPVKRRRGPVPHKVVGAGVIVDRRGRILIAQRRESSMLGGLWEFPGGTLEPGETMRACIARELMEEMGIATQVGAELTVVHHAYSHFTIDLHAHWARILKGRPRTLHCADFAWVAPRGLRRYAFSTADLQILAAVEALPRVPPPGAWD